LRRQGRGVLVRPNRPGSSAKMKIWAAAVSGNENG
jgi:hypothetical protein